MAVFDPRVGVDTVWPGEGVGAPAYQSMTIRGWATTTRLLKLLDA